MGGVWSHVEYAGRGVVRVPLYYRSERRFLVMEGFFYVLILRLETHTYHYKKKKKKHVSNSLKLHFPLISTIRSKKSYTKHNTFSYVIFSPSHYDFLSPRKSKFGCLSFVSFPAYHRLPLSGGGAARREAFTTSCR